jgi:hypothetical protein
MNDYVKNSRMWRDGAGWKNPTREEFFSCGRELLVLPINSTYLDRLGYAGDESACGDCGALKGEVHIPGCDLEECPSCKGQLSSCACEIGTLPTSLEVWKGFRARLYKFANGSPRPELKHVWPPAS